MTEQVATQVLLVAAAYLAFGFLCALATIGWGLRRFGPDAAAMPLRVRMLIMPGLIVLWPLVLARLSGQRATEDKL